MQKYKTATVGRESGRTARTETKPACEPFTPSNPPLPAGPVLGTGHCQGKERDCGEACKSVSLRQFEQGGGVDSVKRKLRPSLLRRRYPLN